MQPGDRPPASSGYRIGAFLASKSGAALSFLLLAAILFGHSALRPLHGWDMIAYIGSVEALSTDDPKAIHAAAYGAARAGVSPELFKSLTEGNAYRRAVYESPEMLKAQLPFYQIRPAYLFAVALAEQLGLNVLLATHMVSALFVTLGAGFIYLTVARFSPVSAPLVAPVIILASFGLQIASLSTADGMAWFAYAAITYLLVYERPNLALALLPLLMTVRTDLLVLALCVVLWVLWFYPELRRSVLPYAAFAASVLTVVGINWWYGNPGWRVLFYHTFISFLPEPSATDVAFGVGDYFRVFLHGLGEPLTDFGHMFFILLATLSLAGFFRNRKSLVRQDWLALGILTIAIGYIALHYVLFPSWSLRYFSPAYAAIAIAFLRLLTRGRQGLPQLRSA